MNLKKLGYWLIFSILLFNCLPLQAAAFPEGGRRKSKNQIAIGDTLSWSLSLMKRVFNGSGEWFLTDNTVGKPIKGIVDYAENEPIDSILVRMNQFLGRDTIPVLFNRQAENITNKRMVPGYLFMEELERNLESRRKTVADSLKKTLIPVPEGYLSEGLSKAKIVPAGNSLQAIGSIGQNMPRAFAERLRKALDNTKFPVNATSSEIDTMKVKLYDWTRQAFNDSILFATRDSLIQSYRVNFVEQAVTDAAARRKGYLMARNAELLDSYNQAEVAQTNESVRLALHYLTRYAANDSLQVTLSNLTGSQTRIWTANHPMNPMRIFLKNEQNDSVSVVLFNNGKGGVRMVIDDGVKFMRFTESHKKEITFDPKKPKSSLQQVNIRHVDQLPWKLLGTGTVGFTQTSLSNWAKGGESSLSLLLIGKYVANYSKKNVKWENMAEFRLGIFNSKTRGLEKNDDKIELQSRLGLAATKKWYYTAESNFRTQMAKGYKYPDKVNPISTFMAPAYLTFSLGMDYKPNKNFSLFLSPFTSKTTFVRDTALIDQTHFGLDPDKKRLWEPGAIAKLNWHWLIIEDITYDTRAEIFNNFRYPFQKFNVDWEQTLVLQVTQRINTRIMSQVIYDYNVKFPVKDANGIEIAQKAKWQFKELFTVGFNYKF